MKYLKVHIKVDDKGNLTRHTTASGFTMTEIVGYLEIEKQQVLIDSCNEDKE